MVQLKRQSFRQKLRTVVLHNCQTMVFYSRQTAKFLSNKYNQIGRLRSLQKAHTTGPVGILLLLSAMFMSTLAEVDGQDTVPVQVYEVYPGYFYFSFPASDWIVDGQGPSSDGYYHLTLGAHWCQPLQIMFGPYSPGPNCPMDAIDGFALLWPYSASPCYTVKAKPGPGSYIDDLMSSYGWDIYGGFGNYSYDPNVQYTTFQYSYAAAFELDVLPVDQPAANVYTILGANSLAADGTSQIHLWLANQGFAPGDITWSIIQGADLATIDPVTGVLTAGKKAGTVVVQAEDAEGCSGTCQVELTCPAQDDGGACASCNNGFGGTSANDSSVDVAVGLGWSSLSGHAGQLSISADYPSSTLATPQGLTYESVRPDVQVITDSQGNLRQVNAPEGLAEITTNSATEYTINLYSATNVLGQTNGLYSLSGTPQTTVTIESPGGDTNQLIVTESRQGVDTVFAYLWVTNGWQLTTGGGLRQETKNTVWSQSNTVRTVTQTVRNADGSVVKNDIQTYQMFPTGEHLTQEILGVGASAQTNTYIYMTNGFLLQSVLANGSWQYYVYDSQDRPIQVFSSFGNQTITTNPALCRMVAYDYSPNDVSGSGDDGHISLGTPRQAVEYLEGQEIKRTYNVFLPNEHQEIQCVAPGAAWNDPNNLVTTTMTCPLSSSHAGEILSVQQPDGTIEIHLYGNGYENTTNITLNGHPDGSGTNIDLGTETVDVIGPYGLLSSRTVYDTPSGIMTSSESYAYDSYYRLTTTTYLDGTYEQNNYDCCTLNSKQNRDGSITYYVYDALKRLVSTTYNGITVSNVFDAEGKILATIRYGTDGTATTNQISTFDTSGFQTSSADALQHLTTYTNYIDGSGQTIKQITYPDLSTRTETYAMDGSLFEVTGTAVEGVRYEYGVEDDNSGVQHAFTETIPLNTDGTDSQEWTKSYTDSAGRAYKTVYASTTGSPQSQSFYNSLGQLSKQVDPDGVTTLYQYDSKGQMAYTAVDMNKNSVTDFSGIDRITYTVSDVVNDNGANVNRTRTYVWPTNNVNASNLVSTVETSVDGLQTWNITWNGGVGLTNYSQTIYDPANGYTIVTTVAPDGSSTVTTNQNGRAIYVTQKDSTGAQIGQTVYGYDTLGRQNTATDARNGTTTSFFNADDQLTGTLTPSPDGVQSGQLTTNVLDSMGRVIQTTLPDNTSVTNVYYPNGLLQETYGSRTYPVQYTYDYAGRMKTMTTWTNFATSSGTATTTWNYDPYRGWLAGKVYADGEGPTYYYTPAGRLINRLWARGILTTYSYDSAGTLKGVGYSDSTPGVSYTFDRLGRQTSVTSGATVCAWIYNGAGQMLSESYAGGPLDGLSVTNGYDNLLRRTTLAALSANSQLLSTAYGYNAASRLSTVSDGTNSAAYTYVANSPLLGNIVFQHNGQTVMTTTKAYDNLNRLTSISSIGGASSASPISSFNYNYNFANQRGTVTNADNSYWVYQYDSLGQVISGKKYWSDGTPVAGQQFTYNFDDIGNRKTTANGGDASGANLRSANYAANYLNQYTSRDVPGYVDILGEANSNATVTVNLQRAYRYGSYFQDELSVDNSSSALWLSLTNLAVLNNGTNADIVATNSGNIFLPQTPEIFDYDADGNLTNDGRFSYTWDGENRLIGIAANANVGSQYQLTFVYDPQGRRAEKIVATNGVVLSTNKFLYDGWNLIVIFNHRSSVLQAFVWGSDLSGSLQGAGGVGGLLWLNDEATINNQPSTHFCAYDGNGNVAALVNAADGTVSANYEYDPFGQTIRATGLMAKADPFRFSTKYQDDESDLLYYGYRYYKPSTGTWPNRDPLWESGGMNLCLFVNNNAIDKFDSLGLTEGGASTYTALAGAMYFHDLQQYQLLNPPQPPAPSTTDGLNSAWQMFFHGLTAPPFDVETVSSALTEQAKQMARLYDDQTLITDAKQFMICGQSGSFALKAPTDSHFNLDPNAGIAHIGDWQLDLTGNFQYSCEKAQIDKKAGSCCCTCQVTAQFTGEFSKTWTFQPWGYNVDNPGWWAAWAATLTYQQAEYGYASGKYFMAGFFEDELTQPVQKCP